MTATVDGAEDAARWRVLALVCLALVLAMTTWFSATAVTPELARARGVKRAMLLPVSAPFHCALMQPAAAAMERALDDVAMSAPIVPLVANASAAKVTRPDEVKRLLVAGITGTVRWRESVTAAVEMGVDNFIELGAGKVLTGLVKRIAPDARGVNAGSPAEIEALLKVL